MRLSPQNTSVFSLLVFKRGAILSVGFLYHLIHDYCFFYVYISYFNPLNWSSKFSVCIRGFTLALRKPAEAKGVGWAKVTDNQPKHPWISLRPTSPLLYFPGQKSVGLPMMKFDAWARIAVCKVDTDHKAFLFGHPHSIHFSSNVKGIWFDFPSCHFSSTFFPFSLFLFF